MGKYELIDKVRARKKRSSRYDNIAYRKAVVDMVLKKRNKEPARLSVYDLQLEGWSLLTWYARKYKCKCREARNILVRELYNTENKVNIKLSGYWGDRNNVEKELKRAIKENNGEFPTHRILVQMGIGSLASAINKFGGINFFRKYLGYKIKKSSSRHYESWGNFKSEMNKAIGENNFEFPNFKRLLEMGYTNLYLAIGRYHDGIYAVREKIGYNEKMRVKLARELEGIVRELSYRDSQ